MSRFAAATRSPGGRTDITIPLASAPGALPPACNATGADARGDPGDLPAIPRRGCGRRHPPAGSLIGGISYFNGVGAPFYGPEGNNADCAGSSCSDLSSFGGISGYFGPEGGTCRRLPGQQHPQRWRTQRPTSARPAWAATSRHWAPPGQIFYIGNGVTTSSDFPGVHRVPSGATRLFLGDPGRLRLRWACPVPATTTMVLTASASASTRCPPCRSRVLRSSAGPRRPLPPRACALLKEQGAGLGTPPRRLRHGLGALVKPAGFVPGALSCSGATITRLRPGLLGIDTSPSAPLQLRSRAFAPRPRRVTPGAEGDHDLLHFGHEEPRVSSQLQAHEGFCLGVGVAGRAAG